MMVRVRTGAADNYRVFSARSNTLYTLDQEKALRLLEGHSVEVDTKYLYQAQYQTKAFPGHPNGIRLQDRDVDQVWNDARKARARCAFCPQQGPDTDPLCKCGGTMIPFDGLYQGDGVRVWWRHEQADQLTSKTPTHAQPQ